MPTYAVKEIYPTLQGEGMQTGRMAVFLRFSGCNLWTGREQDRHVATCNFCDTDFVGTDGPGGGRFASADALASAVYHQWKNVACDDKGDPYVVCTGGEPLLQLDENLIRALHNKSFEVAVETNGTLPVPAGVDWICVSPKADTRIVQRHGHELKLVYPQALAPPADFVDLAFQYFFLQPMDGPDIKKHVKDSIAYCLRHPKWRLSLQSHKAIGID